MRSSDDFGSGMVCGGAIVLLVMVGILLITAVNVHRNSNIEGQSWILQGNAPTIHLETNEYGITSWVLHGK